MSKRDGTNRTGVLQSFLKSPICSWVESFTGQGFKEEVIKERLMELIDQLPASKFVKKMILTAFSLDGHESAEDFAEEANALHDQAIEEYFKADADLQQKNQELQQAEEEQEKNLAAIEAARVIFNVAEGNAKAAREEKVNAANEEYRQKITAAKKALSEALAPLNDAQVGILMRLEEATAAKEEAQKVFDAAKATEAHMKNIDNELQSQKIIVIDRGFTMAQLIEHAGCLFYTSEKEAAEKPALLWFATVVGNTSAKYDEDKKIRKRTRVIGDRAFNIYLVVRHCYDEGYNYQVIVSEEIYDSVSHALIDQGIPLIRINK